jgi:predicted NBD/HSP70 family sugar kinase
VDGEWVPLRAELEARLGLPVAVENDVNVATLGAVALSGIRDLVYLSIGTGLAAGLVLDGTLRRGATGAAGEIGHVPIDPLGAVCQCGQRGCLETVASGRALAEAWLPDGATDGDTPPAQALFAAAAAGDARAIEVRDRFAAGVADAVRTLCLAVDPATIVLGGGVSHLGAPLVDAVSDALCAQAASSPFLASLDLAGRIRVVPDDQPVAAIGAALLGRS